MRTTRIASTACLSLLLLLGAGATAYAQGQGEDHGDQKQSKPQQTKPEQQHAQQQKQPEQKQQQQHAQQQQQQNQNKQAHAQQQQHQQGNQQARGTPEQHRVQQSAWQQHGSQHWDTDHRNWQQRGGYHGYRVPDDRYRGYFGPSHGFLIGGLPFMVVGGYPRFQYEGYWISAVDPWPEYWGANWYDDDDVYVAYVDNGYYMYNSRYPGSGIAISISF
jgi:flagellar motor protein MotB